MYKTKNDLSEMTRAEVVPILNARLADSIDLMHQAKQAHWNVKGPSFIALHKLFDEVVDAAEEYMDLLAERVVQLGGTAEGTIQVATTRTGLKEYPLALTEERDHVEVLSSALAAYGEGVRRAIDQTDELGDRDTADIFTEISRDVDKYLWFVEAHLGSPDIATRRNQYCDNSSRVPNASSWASGALSAAPCLYPHAPSNRKHQCTPQITMPIRPPCAKF